MPDLQELAERLRELALSLPETYEDEPWGHPVFKVGENSMFASMSVAEECVRLTVKLTAEEREIAHLLPYVSTAPTSAATAGSPRRSPTTSRWRPRSSGCARATG